MFRKSLVVDMINRSAENAADRRNFLRSAGLLSAAAVGTGLAGAGASRAAAAGTAAPPSAGAVLNFALNLEYLEAEFYSFAAFGHGIADSLTDGTGTRGGVTGGHRVPFTRRSTRFYAEEIAGDEIAHVTFLRKALGAAAVSRPAIDLQDSFSAAAQAAGLVPAGAAFDPFASEEAFLLGAFLFEDVGVTAYKGAAPLIGNTEYIGAAAGILAVEAYHAGIIRTEMYDRGLIAEAGAISGARDSLDGEQDLDQGIVTGNPRARRANLVPTDADGLAFGRTPQQVLNIVYLQGGAGVTRGGFYPAGLNGEVTTS